MKANQTQKLLIAGASIPIAEAGFAIMHAGALGVICGLAAGVFAYWFADEFGQKADGDFSPPAASDEAYADEPATDPSPNPPRESHSLLYRALNGKSVRDAADTGNPEQAGTSTRRENSAPTRHGRASERYALRLSPDYAPHVNEVLGRCILGVGQRGTGKSNLAARLIEQVGRFPIPMCIGDYKQDYITLPVVLSRCVIAGSPDWEGQQECQVYWQITQENAYQVGAHLMYKGIQLVFECLTYQTLDEAAAVMTLILRGMFDWALRQPSGQRVPALVVLDEAQQFLPQNQGDSRIDPEISSQLFLVFEKLNSVGRSLGLTPALFTQRIAQIRKEVIAGSELFFLMRQTLPQDLKVYEDLIGRDSRGKLLLDRQVVKSLVQGTGLVYEGGEFILTHFEQRESRHLSTTPDLEDALAYYGERHPTMDLRTMEPLAMKHTVPAFSLREPSPSSLDPIQVAISKLVSQLETGQIDQEAFLEQYALIPNYPSGTHTAAMAVQDQQSSQLRFAKSPDALLLERGIEAYRHGATSLDKLMAALDITQHKARQLKPRIEEALRKEQAHAAME